MTYPKNFWREAYLSHEWEKEVFSTRLEEAR